MQLDPERLVRVTNQSPLRWDTQTSIIEAGLMTPLACFVALYSSDRMRCIVLCGWQTVVAPAELLNRIVNIAADMTFNDLSSFAPVP